jgi:serine-type D-Ala-D-Ala carboxypeptidase/endopeptidase (penicillin-binding protein 4)
MKSFYLYFFCFLAILQTACSPKLRPARILKEARSSEVFKNNHVGFALYDLAADKMLVELNADKYFTPASNTKLFTFYAGLKMLKDSIPGLQYTVQNDSLIFWGTGDPTFLHPDFASQPLIAKLNATGKKLFFAPGRYTGDFYGTGWSYDDYNAYYQPEISELPLYANVVRIRNQNGKLNSSPALDEEFFLQTDSSFKPRSYTIRRDLFSNNFRQPAMPLSATYSQEIPYQTSTALTSAFLARHLPNYKGIVSQRIDGGAKKWYSQRSDTVFKRMLQPSDNFIAEQLLLTYAAENGLAMNADSVISYVRNRYLTDLPDGVRWADGSGLSRQNLFTPRDIIALCKKIYAEFPGQEAKLFELLPQGGKAGTIRNFFKTDGEPFVFAKTGTLSNNVNLSGYLVTKSGKRMIFSFMNNNYVRATLDIRQEVERILTQIHDQY